MLLTAMVHCIGGLGGRIPLLLRAIIRQLDCGVLVLIKDIGGTIKSLIQQLACYESAEGGLSLVAGNARLPQPDLPVISNLLQKAFILPFNQVD